MPRLESEGFAILTGVFPAGEIDALSGLLTADGSRSPGLRNALQLPIVKRIAGDRRLQEIATAALGSEAVPFAATLFNKSKAANWLVAWHQDAVLPLRARADVKGWGPWSTKGGVAHSRAPESALQRVITIRLHVDDSTRTNGPLRVLPGSHKHGVLTDSSIEEVARSIAPVECAVPRGGVLVMRPLLVHASSKSLDARPRRVLQIQYAASLDLGQGLELAGVGRMDA